MLSPCHVVKRGHHSNFGQLAACSNKKATVSLFLNSLNLQAIFINLINFCLMILLLLFQFFYLKKKCLKWVLNIFLNFDKEKRRKFLNILAHQAISHNDMATWYGHQFLCYTGQLVGVKTIFFFRRQAFSLLVASNLSI